MTSKAATASSSLPAISRQNLITAALVIGAPLLLVALWKFLPMNDYMRATVEWIESTGYVGIAGFYGVYLLASLVGIPRTPLHVAAGAIFSYPVALLIVLTGAATAYCATFWISRTIARDWVARRIAQSGKVKQLLELVDKEGFKVVMLIRMNLLIPGVLKGYGFGTTNIRFRTYLVASIVGFLPIALAHTYLGWAGGEAVLSGEGLTDVEKWLLIGGVALSIFMVIGVYLYGKKALDRQYPKQESS